MQETAPPSTLWQQGWYTPARACHSPNFGPRPTPCIVDLVVIHCISLPPGEYAGQAVEAFFCNQLDWDAHPLFDAVRGLKVSAHFLIYRNGELIQFVDCDARAWHAGVSCFRGRENCNDFSIGIELEGLVGDAFTVQQYQSLNTLLLALKQRYPIASVTGHSDIAPQRKQDPGPGFDWSQLTLP